MYKSKMLNDWRQSPDPPGIVGRVRWMVPAMESWPAFTYSLRADA